MRVRAGREHGIVVKKCRKCLKVALLYPAEYRAAVASLAYQNLYYMINSLDYAVAERFVYEGRDIVPRSIETGAKLKDFDLIVAPVSFELDYSKLVQILLASGIEPLKSRRTRGDPILVLGGPVPSMNPSVALTLADIVALGDAEPIIPPLLEKAYEDDLDSILCNNGFLAQTCSYPVSRAVATSLDELFHSTIQFREPGSGEPWGEAYMVEASRGCKYMCKFCMEAYFSLPLRHRGFSTIKKLVDKGIRANNVRKVAFYALSFFDHPASDKLLEYIIKEGLAGTIGSLRADTLTPDRIELLRLVGQTVVTIAPETLSPKLCRVIGKCIDAELVEEVAFEAWKRRMHVKLYLMVGLPGESLSDVEYTVNRIASILREAPSRKDAIRISVNPLIPKPWTPLQFAQFISEKEYMARAMILRKLASKIAGIDILSYRFALVEAIIARGGSWLGPILRKWGEMGGKLGQFLRILREAGISIDKLRNPPKEMEWVNLVKPGFPRKALQVSWLNSLSVLKGNE